MQMVNLTIDGKQIQATAGSSVLEAARSAGIYIPTLCYHPDLRPEGACRLCMVEASGARTLVASCVYPVSEGMVVKTNTSKVREARKTVRVEAAAGKAVNTHPLNITANTDAATAENAFFLIAYQRRIAVINSTRPCFATLEAQLTHA